VSPTFTFFIALAKVITSSWDKRNSRSILGYLTLKFRMILESKSWVPAVVFGEGNKFDVGKLHFWMTRSIVKKNKGLLVFDLHFGVEFLKIFQKYHSCHPCFGVCLPDDLTR